MSCSNPTFLPYVLDWKKRPVPIPCGKCICCRMSKVSLMEQRAKWEFNNHASASFVTFTYDDNHLPFENGFLQPTLRRDHLHKYIDTLRHNLRNSRIIFPRSVDKNFTFLSSGEYGDRFNRPHYHVIFFGIPVDVCRSILIKSWHNGSIKVLPVKNGCIRYVLKYLSKQQFGKNADSAYFDYGLESPFVMFSKGFGSGYFKSQMKNIFKFGLLKFGQKELPCPTYWKYKYFNFTMKNILDIEARRVEREHTIFEQEAKPRGYKCYEDYHWRNIRNRESNLYFKAISNREQVFHDYSFPARFVHSPQSLSLTTSELVNKILEFAL